MPEITASNNPFPSILNEETASASVSTPSAGQQRLFIDTSDHHLKRKNSSGTVTDLENFGTVSTTGSPSNGNLAKFSAAATITNGDLSGDVTTSGTLAATIANDAVTNAKMANMAQSTIKGRAVSAGTGDPTDLTATQATAILDAMVGDSGSGGTKGLVPAPASGDTAAGKFLKADGTWSAPSGTGAPSSAQYVCLATDSGLSEERVLTAGTGITITDGGANGNVTIASTGGGLVLLEQHTASSSASLDFTSCISSTYDEYLIEFVNIVTATDNTTLNMRMSTNGGLSYDSGANYAWGKAFMASNGVGSAGADGGATSISINNNTGNTTNFSVNGSIRLFNPGGSIYKALSGWTQGRVSSGDARRYMQMVWGQYESTTAVNAFQVFAGSGNIASGTIRCYGVAK